MAETIDSLQIEINAKASKANDAIDRIVGKIDRLTSSMNKLDGSNLASLANGVQRLGTAMQTMNNVKTADFTRLAKNLQSLNNISKSMLPWSSPVARLFLKILPCFVSVTNHLLTVSYVFLTLGLL